MTTPETDARRFRLLQIVEVETSARISSGLARDTLRGQHFHVADELFQEDLAWLEGRGYLATGPLDHEVWISLTDAGREVIDLAQPGPALRSIALGRGAHLVLCNLCSHGPVSGATLDILAEAARSLVDAALDNPKAAPDPAAEPDAHLGAREAS